MSAAGLSDVYRYGVRFVGYLLAVTLAAGVFVAGGALAGGSVLTDVADGGAAAATTGPLVAGIALIAIGVLLFLSGLSGLVYKLIADAAMAGVAQGRAVELPAAGGEEADAADDGEGAAAGAAAAGTVAADTPDEESPADGAEDATDPEQDLGEEESADDVTATTDEQTVVEASPEPEDQPSAPGNGADSPTEAAATNDQPDDWAADDGSGADEPSSASTSADEWVDQSSGEVASAGEADTTDGDEEPAGTAQTEPEEWSPPDPSEFETEAAAESGTTDDSATADAAEESLSVEEPSEWETDESDESSPDSPRTADDLFGETDDGGDDDTVDDVSDLFSGDDDTAGADEGDSDDTAGESTPFETKSDSDPLSDALDDS